MINRGVIIVVGVRRNKQLADIGTAPRGVRASAGIYAEGYLR